MRATTEAVIAGGGIVGAACALELARAGLRVTVVEPSVVGGGATAAGMGHIVVMDDSDAQFALTRYSQTLWDELAPSLPAECEYERRGTLWVAADEEELAAARRKQAAYAARGVAAECIDGAALAQAEPSLRPGLAGGVLVPGDSIVYPPCVAAHLLAAARALGARFLPGRRVVSLGEAGATLEDGTQLPADFTVNATGTWSPELCPGLVVRPRKGHLLITDRYPRLVNHQLVELGYLKSAHASEADSVAFNAQPRRTGQLLIGSSRQFAASAGVDFAMLSRMLQRAAWFLPRLGTLTAIRVWTGYRAATADDLPLIGPAPGRPNLYLATGHEGLGITTSLGTARLLADQILGRPSPIPFAPYLPSRAPGGSYA
jgi:glycine/D-amino acid oxidase-like deaminating enzyme